MSNPFSPSFGATPPKLLGRSKELASFKEALQEGPGSPGRAMLFTGARGMGKTVLLNEIENIARDHGWETISETATPGVAQRLRETYLPLALEAWQQNKPKSHITSVTVSGVGSISRSIQEDRPIPPTLRILLSNFLDVLEENGAGLLITLDEVHRDHIEDLREIATAIQHLFREGRQIMFVAAGLPHAIHDLLNDNILTFLRRAERYSLGLLSPQTSRASLTETFEEAGKSILPEALELAVSTSRGYPYLVQLLGYHAWRLARESGQITSEVMQEAAEIARSKMTYLVHEPALSTLSQGDLNFLRAMAQDKTESKIADIAGRLGKTVQEISVYRRRLLKAEVIAATGRGKLSFVLPYMQEFIANELEE